MNKVAHFFIGAFLASIFIITVFLGMSFIAVEKIEDIITVIFLLVLALIVMLTLLLLFKDKILASFGIRVKTQSEEIVEAVAKTIGDAVNGNKEATKENSKELATVALSWYSWTSLYRWVIRTAIALLITFTGFAGTALLIQQNDRIESQTKVITAQNALMMKQELILENQKDIQIFSLNTQLKTPFLLRKSNVSLRGWIQKSEAEQCSIDTAKEIELYLMPDVGAIESTIRLVTSSSLKNELIKMLIEQLKDQHQTARLGALIILDRLGEMPDNKQVTFEEVYVSNLKLSSNVNIHFYRSLVTGLECEGCQIQAHRSLISDVNIKKLNSRESLIQGVQPEKVGVAEYNAFYFSSVYGGRNHDPALVNDLLQRSTSVRIGPIRSPGQGISIDPYKPVCKRVIGLCENNAFAECSVPEGRADEAG